MLRGEPRTDAFESFTFCGLPVVSDEANQLLTNHVGGPSFKHFLHAASEFSRDHADFNATAGERRFEAPPHLSPESRSSACACLLVHAVVLCRPYCCIS